MEQQAPKQLNHLVRQHKSPETCSNKGPGANFPEVFDDLFTKENSHDKFSMTNETDMPVLLPKTFATKQMW